jgi:pimeloyl-ACP methyl ester carboxylesterase
MHGLGGEPEGHDKLLGPLLTPEHRSFIGDALGRGEAVRVVAPYMRPESGKGIHTMTDQLQRARAVIDAQDGPVILMGHSFGGKAAIKLAQEYGPDKVTGVIALAPSVNMLYSYWKQVTGERGLPKDPQVIDARLGQVEASLARRVATTPTPRTKLEKLELGQLRGELQYARQMRDLVRHDEASMEGPGALQRPMLLFHGTEDKAVSIHYAQRFAEGNAPNVKLVTLPEVDHGFGTEPPVTKAMAREIATFIKANRRPAESR